MALTAAQQAALDSVRGRLASQTEDEQDSGLNDAQKAAIEAARARLGDRAPAAQEGDVGFGEGMYNAVARGLSNLGSIPDAMRAEEFSTLADARARQAEIDAERARTGEEAPWWERALLYRPSWAAPLETEEELRGLAADHAQAVAQRRFDAQRNYPMTEAGAQALQDIMNSGGFFPGLGTALMNPLDTASGIAQVVGEQIPTIVGAGAASYVTKNPNVGLAAFAGSGYSQERYGQLVPEAEKAGYNLLDRQGAMAAVSDSEFMQAQAERGQVRGVIIGGVDLITAGLASRAPLTLRGLATQTGVQVAGGGVGEAAAELATDGKINAGEVIIEALAEGVSAPADVAAFAANRPSNTGSDINSQEAMARAQEEAALQAQQAAEAEAAAQEEALAVDAIKEARLDARETFISEQEFVRLRNEARAADILNRDTEIGQAFRQWQKDNDIVERDQKTQNQFLRDYVSQNDAEQARQEYLAALDEHAIYRQVDAQRTPETRAEIQQTKAELVTELQEARASGDQEALRLVEEKANNLLSPAEWRAAKMEADGIIKTEANTATAEAAADEAATATPAETPKLTKRDTLRQYATEKLGENWEQDNPELSQLFSDGKGIYSRGKGKKSRFESMVDRIVAEQQQSQPAAETNAEPEANPQTEVLQDNTPDTNTETPVQTEENAETPQPLTGVDAQAEQYAQEKLGPNWRNENPQLLELLSGKRYARFQSTVDTIAERKTPAETVETATKDVEQLFSQPMEGAKLSPNEQKVWDTINDAFQNNGQDEVIQVDGSWNTQAIAEKAGLKSRQAAQTALTRLKPKIAKAYGLDQADIKETLAATRIKNVEAAPDINAPTSELDMADLAEGQGFNTKASANQGAAEGVDAEDVAYTQARSEEPDQYENKRQEIADRQRQQDNVAMVKQFGQLAVRTWKNIATDNAVAINQLSKQDLMEWVSIVAEHDAGMIDDAQLAADQREIEMRYDAQPALENANETATIEGTATAVEDAGPAEGADTGPQASAESGGQAEQVGTANTGNAGQQRPTVVVTKKRKKIDPQKAKTENPRFGVRPDATATASREAFNEAVNELTGAEENARIHVFENEQQALEAVENGDVPSVDVDQLMEVQPYGWVTTDDDGVPHAHFILDRIPAGGERAAFMHEIGGHMGIDSIIDQATSSEIAKQIADWAGANDGSLESRIALRAIQRLDLAAMRGGVSDGVVISEAIAYFLEEATLEGVTPSSTGPLGNFVARIYDAFVAALRKLGINKTDTLTAQDIVDLAYGAARVELVEGSLDPTTDTRAFTEPSMGVQQNQADAKFGLSRDWTKQNLGETATKFFDDASFIARNAVNSTKFLHQFIRENLKTMPSAGRWYKGMLEAEKTRNDIRRSVEDIATQARDLAADRLDAVNDFIGKSTFYQKWGYDPQWQGKTVKVDPIMKAAFDRLNPKEQALVKAIFQHGENMRQRKQNIAKQLGVQGKFFTDASLEGPYAPLKRFGNFAAELKSQDLLDAEADVAANPNKINRDRAEKLRSNPDHYVISFFDTLGAARQFADASSKNFAFTEASERAPDFNDDRISNPEVFEKVLGELKANQNAAIDPAAKTAFADMVKKLYFQSLDERSARLSGARRMNRAGYEKNMIRSFLSHARAEAALVANMEHGAEINTAFADAANEAKTNRAKLQGVYNMIAKHYRDTLAGKETPIQDRIAAMNSVYMLTTSVGYHLTNATQPAMVTIPRLAGDFNNYSGAWGALIRGYKVSLKAAKMSGNFEADIDINKAPPRYRKLLEDLQLRQLLDVGMEEDLSGFDRFNTGYEPLNRLTDKLGKVVHKLYQVARFVEAHNRISAAVAAFDMASNNRAALAKLNMTPEEYATAVVEDTQGNFSRLDAPLLVKSLPKLTTQYRKYQLIMAWAYGNAFDAAFRDKTISAEEKAMGRRTLGYMLGHAGLFAGATGIPLLTTIAPYVLAFIEDAEEPQDLERWIRENVEDERLADVLTRGLPAFFGIDMSTKLSQSKIFHPFPYVDFEASEDGVRDMFFNALAGPAGTTALNFGRAASYFEQGDLLKGIEYSVPKGIRTMIESYRLATEGFTVRNGDVIVDPREIDISSLLLNAVGIPSTEINQIKWTRGQQFELQQYISDESSRIRREYIRAHDDNDRARLAELRQEWRDLQDVKDRIRPFFGGSPRELRRQSVSDLLRAPYQQDRRERMAQRRFQ